MNLLPFAPLLFVLPLQDPVRETRLATDCVQPWGTFPRPATSFGAALADGHVYTLGGYFGTPHDYSREFQDGVLRRMSVATGEWEDLSPVGGIQGLALVAHRGTVVRIGGLRIENADGEPERLRSTDEVARYEPDAGTWTALPPLPEPRSSHLAATIGDEVWVAGGWNLAEDGRHWHRTVAVLDLANPSSGWREVEAPFERRAVGVASAGNHLYVLGGISGAETSRRLDLLDTVSGEWSRGPDLPGNAFGVALVASGGRLFASGMDGVLWSLSVEDGSIADAWEPEAMHLFPRFFHQLVETGEGRLLTLGGMSGGVRPSLLERIAVDGTAIHRWTLWRLPLTSTPEDRLLQHGAEVLGLRPGAPAWRLALPDLEVTAAEVPPAGIRTMEAAWIGDRRALAVPAAAEDAAGTDAWSFDDETGLWMPVHDALPPGGERGPLVRVGEEVLLLGAGPDSAVLRWDGESRSFATTGAHVPDGRRGFAHAVHGGRVHLHGGIDADGAPVLEGLVLDPASWTWSASASLPAGRRDADLVAVAGRFVLAGGRDVGGPRAERPSTGLLVLAPGTDGWRELELELPLEDRPVRALAHRDRLLLLAPEESGESTLLAVVELGSRRLLQQGVEHP